TQNIPMLSKTSKIAYQDLHKTGLGFADPWYGKKARLSQPSLYCEEDILKPVHPKPLVHDSEETTALSEVIRATMSKKPGHVQPINYDKLNALYSQFVPQKELSREQVYWQSPADVGTLTTPVKPFVKTHPASSQVREKLECIKKTFPGNTTGCLNLKHRYKENLKNQRVLDNSNAMASNAIFEITLLKDQLRERDETVRNLQSKINIYKMLNLGAQKAEITSLKAKRVGKPSGGTTKPANPNVIAPGMYAVSL
nr:hypothetical protein [Tanacetum cinerariifolium]